MPDPINLGSGAARDIIVIGASAGGVAALQALLAELSEDLPAAVFIVMHSAAEYSSRLPDVLSRSCRLPVSHAVHGEQVRLGRVLVAPPDNHLTLERRFVRVVRGPKDNGHRPAVDPLFQTAARAFGTRVMGVILSGSLSCGTRGLIAVKARGGLALVQDPEDALFDGMPRSALAHVTADHQASARELGRLLRQLSGARVAERPADGGPNGDAPAASFPAITCPECSGSMVEHEESGFVRFRCHVGHAFSLDGLVQEQGAALEAALWAAVRSLEESASMALRVALRADPRLVARFEEKAQALRQHAGLLKEWVMTGMLTTAADASLLTGPPLNGPTQTAEGGLRSESPDRAH